MGCVLGRPVSSSDSVSGSRHQISSSFESNRKQVNETVVSVTRIEPETFTSTVVPVAAAAEVREENEKPKGERKRSNKADPKHLIGGEQVVAGWPSWLSEICGEALNGWLPRKADSFDKIEKVRAFLFLHFICFLFGCCCYIKFVCFW